MKEQTQNDAQLDMFSNPEDKKRIAELEEELKNLKAAYTLFGPPHTPIIKNIGIKTASKNK